MKDKTDEETQENHSDALKFQTHGVNVKTNTKRSILYTNKANLIKDMYIKVYLQSDNGKYQIR